MGYRYGIGKREVTVRQWVKFLNTVDPTGSDLRHLYSSTESSAAWPKYGQINFSATARDGRHYTVAFDQWTNKPYGFADFLRAARFANSVQNGDLISKRVVTEGGVRVTRYRVRLSRRTERGMYDLARDGAAQQLARASAAS